MDKYNEIFSKYDLKVYNVYRARGAFLLDTDSGFKLLKKVEGNKNHIIFEHRVKEHLLALGNSMIDTFICNIDGEIISSDQQNNSYIIRNWFEGDSCDFTDLHHVKMAVKNLAKVHNNLSHINFLEEDELFFETNNLTSLFDKRNKELRRVRSYIRNKKQKNVFEVKHLKNFDTFYNQAEEAEYLLKNSDYERERNFAISNKKVCHGSYTYHNILIHTNSNATNGYNTMLSASDIQGVEFEGVATTNFDKSYIGMQLSDLYLFMRKVMEKNNWDLLYGSQIIEAYHSMKEINKDELNILYIMLLYPEKFWKITNFYYNNKKSWISQRSIQKLDTVCEQNSKKELFLSKLRNIL